LAHLRLEVLVNLRVCCAATTPPRTLADAEEQRLQITLEIQGLQAQLGDRQRSDEAGRRLSPREYWNWKGLAQQELNQKLDELRIVKAWIRDHRPPHVGPLSPDTFTVVSHLESLYRILETLRKEDVELDSDELAKIEAARMTLAALGTPRQKELYAKAKD